jgi:hypothetical protein
MMIERVGRGREGFRNQEKVPMLSVFPLNPDF